MNYKVLSLSAALVLAAPSIVFAKPSIGSVTPTTATAGLAVNLTASVSSAAAIQRCSLWVDLAEVGDMNVSGGVASRTYTFTSGGSRIAFVFCKDVNGEMASGPNTGITVSGAIVPTPTPTPTPTPVPTPTPTPTPAPTPIVIPTTTLPLVPPVNYTDKLVKLACPTTGTVDVNHPCKAVYFVGKDGKRHAFPNSDVFFTWYENFDSVMTVTPEVLSSYLIGTNVTYRAGVKMVKFTTTPKVYAVARGSVLRGIATEEIAKTYYGADWNKKIADISDAFYTNYTFGTDINAVSDYTPSEEFANSKN